MRYSPGSPRVLLHHHHVAREKHRFFPRNVHVNSTSDIALSFDTAFSLVWQKNGGAANFFEFGGKKFIGAESRGDPNYRDRYLLPPILPNQRISGMQSVARQPTYRRDSRDAIQAQGNILFRRRYVRREAVNAYQKYYA